MPLGCCFVCLLRWFVHDLAKYVYVFVCIVIFMEVNIENCNSVEYGIPCVGSIIVYSTLKHTFRTNLVCPRTRSTTLLESGDWQNIRFSSSVIHRLPVLAVRRSPMLYIWMATANSTVIDLLQGKIYIWSITINTCLCVTKSKYHW